jgi:hypothetical protein
MRREPARSPFGARRLKGFGFGEWAHDGGTVDIGKGATNISLRSPFAKLEFAAAFEVIRQCCKKSQTASISNTRSVGWGQQCWWPASNFIYACPRLDELMCGAENMFANNGVENVCGDIANEKDLLYLVD